MASMWKVAAATALLLAAGCAAAESPADPVSGVWAEVFGRQDAAPFIDWRDGDCGGEQKGKSVWNAEARTAYCLGGQAMSEDYVWVARWEGATFADRELARRVAHEFIHSHVMRLGVYDGDFHHEGPEWAANGPGSLEDAAIAYLQASPLRGF